MIAEAIDKLRGLFKEAHPVIDVHGEPWDVISRGYVRPILPRKEETPSLISLHSLTSLRDLIRGGMDDTDINPDECFIHVVSPDEVRVVTKLFERGERLVYATTNATCVKGVELQRASLEEAQVALRTCFDESEHRELIIKYLGTVTDEDAVVATDDGLSQKIVVQTGVAGDKEQVTVPIPIILRPYWSFNEVDSPQVPFHPRLHKGGTFSLTKAGGARWQAQAIQCVVDWLKGELDGWQVVG